MPGLRPAILQSWKIPITLNKEHKVLKATNECACLHRYTLLNLPMISVSSSCSEEAMNSIDPQT